MKPVVSSTGKKPPRSLMMYRNTVVFLGLLLVILLLHSFRLEPLPSSKKEESNSTIDSLSPTASHDRSSQRSEQQHQVPCQWNATRCQEHLVRTSLSHGRSNSAKSSTKDQLRAAIDNIPQCTVMGEKFALYTADYLYRHYFDSTQSTSNVLMYSCEPNKGHYCGGMGDRFRGMITTLWLGLLSDRKFELYHPTPVPLQTYLEPHLVNYIPSVPLSYLSRTVAEGFTTDQELVDGFVQSIPVDKSMMRLQKHKRFVQMLDEADRNGVKVLRVQSNSAGIDHYLHRSERLRKVKVHTLGVPLSCNISCYYGCLHSILFAPSAALQQAFFQTMGVNGTATPIRRGSLEEVKARVPPFIAVQVRVGGEWAQGMRVKEPFRTPPKAVPHFMSLVDELRAPEFGQRVAMSDIQLFAQSRPDWLTSAKLFVSSDAARLITMFAERYGKEVVRFVEGDAFQHTDTLTLGDVRPEKYEKYDANRIRTSYFLTLLNHVTISLSSHVVMAQSGFGDTAFWASRSSASCIFVDMNNYKLAWQHHLCYGGSGGTGRSGSAIAVGSRTIDIAAPPAEFYKLVR